MEMMLSVPPEFIVGHVHLCAEAELLLHIGDLGAKLDNVLEVTLEQASDYARCHSILKASVQSSMSNGLYVSESVTRHHAALGIDATNLTLLDSHVHAVLDQLAAEQNKLRRFLATNRMFVHELEASGESAALLKSKAQIDSQATHISETEHKADESLSSSSSLFAATRHRDDAPSFDDNPIVH
ncbi:hypothetical protein DYB30_003814 [Aphanomyces astaci]|uniref:Uncharacterized protein n=2 Tax=Aphanomyces astaci TaxID=112090 RepID=A0A397DRY6_APHAT|nr:hypothetical protein DYB30_003814 [Aphanomyces astaci]